MGSLRPKFESIPEEYYPLTMGEAFAYAALVVGTIGCMLGLMIGSLYWVREAGLESFVQIWSMAFLCFVVILLIAFYVGGRSRLKETKRLILLAQQQQELSKR